MELPTETSSNFTVEFIDISSENGNDKNEANLVPSIDTQYCIPKTMVMNVRGISTDGGWDLLESATCPHHLDFILLLETKGNRT
jgi:hypothetical protein